MVAFLIVIFCNVTSLNILWLILQPAIKDFFLSPINKEFEEKSQNCKLEFLISKSINSHDKKCVPDRPTELKVQCSNLHWL